MASTAFEGFIALPQHHTQPHYTQLADAILYRNDLCTCLLMLQIDMSVCMELLLLLCTFPGLSCQVCSSSTATVSAGQARQQCTHQ